MTTKQENHINNGRVLMGNVKLTMNSARALLNEYNALYTNLLTEEDFCIDDDGAHCNVIPVSTRLQAYQDAIAVLSTILTAWDAGQHTTIERVVR